ncbi:MAG: PSD1 domain-containing protein, partial [Blastocatellia bacterium]|nr:PSD1 domain-containing protein [Blastocatellia bacterium]
MPRKSYRNLKVAVCLIILLTFILTCALALSQAEAQQPIDFKRDIQPIFADRCYQCHSAKKVSGQLRLDAKASALKGGISGAAVIPGNSKDSLLVRRLLGAGGEARMPMTGPPLTPQQIDLIRRWIDLGANWPGDEPETGPQKHWAYIKPVRSKQPSVKNSSWVRNPIDSFILARLEKENLLPSAEADRTTLLRRVYLDLIGLPPAPQEVDEFLADRSPDAYEKVVDSLLRNPHFGERWARPWLDLARYADSNGYERDRPRVMWKYRDWVIEAFNKNIPFDQFTIEQLAGDMLPNPSNDQLIATGFHRNTMLNQEGGVDDEEARWETIIDRVNTTATVWLGSTIACAQCHNHKYDPFSQKEYYKLFAFFDSHEYSILVMPGNEGWVVEPELELPTPEQAEKRKEMQAELKTIEAKLKTTSPELEAAESKWLDDLRNEPNKWTTLDPVEFKAEGGSKLEKLADKSLRASGEHPVKEIYSITAQLPPSASRLTALRLEAIADPSLPQGGPGRNPYGNFVLSGIEVFAGSNRVDIARVDANDSIGKPDLKQLLHDDKQAEGGGWMIDATRDEKRLNREIVFTFSEPIQPKEGTTLTIKVKQIGRVVAQGLGRIRLSVTESDDPQFIVSLPARLRPLLAIPADKWSTKQTQAVSDQFNQTTPLLAGERERIKELRTGIDNLGIVKAQIIREKQSFERPSTELRERGNYMSRGERVYAGTPAALHPWPEDAPYNRLGLAKWIVSKENPLTARVTVNRLWEAIFGRGIVETSEDFGSQGSPPTHPELLDWLALEFMQPTSECETQNSECGKYGSQPHTWDLKHIIRLIVTSATYRQDSAVKPELLERDPYNRLLARGPRFRLDAEAIRDTALAASGLLSRKIGGPSVYPRQPEGIWMNPYDGNTIKWNTSKGEDLYRRSIYTFLRRTAPYPMMTTFDATSREYCTVRRVRTNTPLQALNLLNDEAIFEMAHALARRMMVEARGGVDDKLGYGFRLCLARLPVQAELERLR